MELALDSRGWRSPSAKRDLHRNLRGTTLNWQEVGGASIPSVRHAWESPQTHSGAWIRPWCCLMPEHKLRRSTARGRQRDGAAVGRYQRLTRGRGLGLTLRCTIKSTSATKSVSSSQIDDDIAARLRAADENVAVRRHIEGLGAIDDRPRDQSALAIVANPGPA